MTFSLLKDRLFNSYMIYGAKIFIALAGAVILPLFFNQGVISIPAILGVVAAGLTELDDNPQGRLKSVTIILLAFFIASAGVELLFPYPILFFTGLIIATMAFVLLGVLGQRYATIAFGALVISIYTMLAYRPERAWFIQPLLLVGGALWYNLLSFLLSLLWPTRPLQEGLATCYSELSSYLTAKAQFFDPDGADDFETQKLALSTASIELAQILDETRSAIMRRLRNDRGKRSTRELLTYFLTAQEIFERANSSHVQYQALRHHFKHSDVLFRFQRLLLEQGIACRKVSDELIGRLRYQHQGNLLQLAEALQASLNYLQEYHQAHEEGANHRPLELIGSMGALLKNLRAISRLLSGLAEIKERILDTSYIQTFLPPEPKKSGGFVGAVEKLKQNLTRRSELFRHAVRMGVAMGVGYLLVLLTYQVVPLLTGEAANMTTPYWILLTVVFVCQPNYSATRSRLIKRFWGTLFGVLASLVMLSLGLAASKWGQMVMVMISGTLFFTFRRARYAYATAFITIMVLICFNLIDAGFVAPERFIDTILGCLLSWLVVTYIWPDWKFRDLTVQMDRILEANLTYLKAIQQQYHIGREDHVAYLMARDNANSSDGSLASLFANLSVEPKQDPEELEYVFQLLCKNNTMLGYISALGAHRAKIEAKEILSLLDRSLSFISTSIEERAVDLNILEEIRGALKRERVKLRGEQQSVEAILVQQLLLILKSLPDYLSFAMRRGENQRSRRDKIEE